MTDTDISLMRSTIGLGTGRYLNPQTGESYGTEVIEGAYRSLVAGR